jgi:hypothetical protein
MMRTALLLAALSAFIAADACAESQAPAAYTVISPIFGQLVMFAMPGNFAAIGENTNGPSYIREAVPKGETAERWTQMVTVTGAKGLVGNPKVSPEAFAGSIVGGFKSACPDSFAARALGPTKFGEYDGFVALAGCGRVEQAPDKHSETALVITIKGSADYYTLQWAERAPASAMPAIDDAKWQERLRLLQPIRLCPVVAGERAPYPSCVGRN